MLTLAILLNLFLLIAFVLVLVSILSNQWFFISVQTECQRWNCAGTQYFENTIQYGLWYACPLIRTSADGTLGSTGNGLAWVGKPNIDSICFQFKSLSSQSEASLRTSSHVYSKYLRNEILLDVPPNQIFQIRVLMIVGEACLFVAGIWSFIILIFLCSRPDGLADSWCLHAIGIFLFIFIHFVTGLIAFILFSISSNNYLDFLFRTSYTLNNNNNYFSSENNEFIRELLVKYKISREWAYWLYLVSVCLSFACLIAIIAYLTFARVRALLYDNYYSNSPFLSRLANCKATQQRRTNPDCSIVCSDMPTITLSNQKSGGVCDKYNDLFFVDDFYLKPTMSSSKRSRYLTQYPAKELPNTSFLEETLNGARTSYYYDDFLYKDLPTDKSKQRNNEYVVDKYYSGKRRTNDILCDEFSNRYRTGGCENSNEWRSSMSKQATSKVNDDIKPPSSSVEDENSLTEFKKIIIREKIKQLD